MKKTVSTETAKRWAYAAYAATEANDRVKVSELNSIPGGCLFARAAKHHKLTNKHGCVVRWVAGMPTDEHAKLIYDYYVTYMDNLQKHRSAGSAGSAPKQRKKPSKTDDYNIEILFAKIDSMDKKLTQLVSEWCNE